MFNPRIGIRMCHNKKIRRELGTINYNQTEVSVKMENINYEEYFQKKEEKEKKPKKKTLKRKIQIKQKRT